MFLVEAAVHSGYSANTSTVCDWLDALEAVDDYRGRRRVARAEAPELRTRGPLILMAKLCASGFGGYQALGRVWALAIRLPCEHAWRKWTLVATVKKRRALEAVGARRCREKVYKDRWRFLIRTGFGVPRLRKQATAEEMSGRNANTVCGKRDF